MRREVAIDIDDLPPADRRALLALVSDARAEGPSAPSRMPDAFLFTVRIDGERFDLDDASMPPAWRRLVEWVLER